MALANIGFRARLHHQTTRLRQDRIRKMIASSPEIIDVTMDECSVDQNSQVEFHCWRFHRHTSHGLCGSDIERARKNAQRPEDELIGGGRRGAFGRGCNRPPIPAAILRAGFERPPIDEVAVLRRHAGIVVLDAACHFRNHGFDEAAMRLHLSAFAVGSLRVLK